MKYKFTCNKCSYDFWIDVTLPPLPHKGELFCPSCGWKTRDFGIDNFPNKNVEGGKGNE